MVAVVRAGSPGTAIAPLGSAVSGLAYATTTVSAGRIWPAIAVHAPHNISAFAAGGGGCARGTARALPDPAKVSRPRRAVTGRPATGAVPPRFRHGSLQISNEKPPKRHCRRRSR